MWPDLYRHLLRQAKRHSRRPEEAEELAHDVLAEAIARGVVDWAPEALGRWLSGAVRRRAAFLARGAARRQGREAAYASVRALPEEAHPPSAGRQVTPTLLKALSPALRTTALLVATGMTRAELCWTLGLRDVALRQRVSQLRRALEATPEAPDAGLAEDRLLRGRIRQALLAALARHPRPHLGSHDPDGHLLLFEVRPTVPTQESAGPPLTKSAGAATETSQPLTPGGTNRENPC